MAHVEPVVGLFCGCGVVEREHGERLLQRLSAADGIERVASALQAGYFHLVVGARREPLSAVESVFHLLRQLIARGVAQREADRSALFAQHLFGQVGAEGQRLVAHGQRHASHVGLARLVGDVGRYHEVIEHGVARLGHDDGHTDGERAVVGGHRLALGQHLVVAVLANDHLVPVRVVGEPPVGAPAHYLVLHLGALHLDAGVRAGRTHHADGVSVGVGRLHTRNLHFKRRALVLLHAEAVAVGVGNLVAAALAQSLHGVDAGQPRRGQLEVGTTRAIVVGDRLLCGHRLIVGIVQLQRDLHPGIDGVIDFLVPTIEDDGGVHRLAWPVHLAVGIDAAAVALVAAGVVAEVVALAEGAAVLVVAVGGKDGAVTLLLLPGVFALAPLVGGQLEALHVAVVARVGRDVYLCALQRLARDGVDGHQAQLPVGHGLDDDAHIAHEEQLARDARGGGARQLYHIHADGQRGQAQHAVEQLVFLMPAQLDGLRQVGLRREQALHVVLILVFIIGIMGEGAVALHTVHLHGHRRDAAHVGEADVAPLSRGDHLVVQFAMIFQGDKSPPLVAQRVDVFPLSPSVEGHVYIGHLLLCRGACPLLHEQVALYGRLAAGVKVAEAVDEAVQALQVGRVVERLHLAGALLLVELHGGQQFGRAVARRGVVVAQHVEAPRLVAYHREQVVVEELAVSALVDNRLVGIGLGGGQQVGVLQRAVVILVGNLLVAVLVEHAVVLVDIAQHGAVDGPQHTVLGLLLAHLEALHGGLQRVGADAAERPGLLQLGLQQHGIVATALGLGGNLAQQLLLRLRKVIVDGLLHFLPQIVHTILSGDKHRY